MLNNKEQENKTEYSFQNAFVPNESLLLGDKKKGSDIAFILTIFLLVAIMVVVIFLNTFVFFNVRVSGPSMQPTLYTGNVLVANRYGKIERGAIIIIKGEKPGSDDLLIKRVIGLPGDTIEFVDGYVKVNGERLEENYLSEQGKTFHDTPSIEVMENEVFYLGDNRQNSSDSRHYGTCEMEQILGVVELWSLKFKNIKR